LGKSNASKILIALELLLRAAGPIELNFWLPARTGTELSQRIKELNAFCKNFQQ